jgi:hypothetical protein
VLMSYETAREDFWFPKPLAVFVVASAEKARNRRDSGAYVRRSELVPLLQADLVHAHVDNDTPRVDGLGALQLVFHDAAHRLRRDAQPPRDVLLGAADQQLHDVLLESVGVAGVLTLERRDQVLTMIAASTAVKDPFIDPEARLAAHVEVPHHA